MILSLTQDHYRIIVAFVKRAQRVIFRGVFSTTLACLEQGERNSKDPLSLYLIVRYQHKFHKFFTVHYYTHMLGQRIELNHSFPITLHFMCSSTLDSEGLFIIIITGEIA